jgi:hypothetical protein
VGSSWLSGTISQLAKQLAVEANDSSPPVGDGAGYLKLNDATNRRIHMLQADDPRFRLNFRMIQARNHTANVWLLGSLEDSG